MKSTVLSFLMIASLSILCISCGDDESCTQADWTGSYVGTSTVTSDGETESDIPTTVTISANGTELLDVEVEFDLGGGATESTTIPGVASDGCSASFTQTGINADMDLDGNDLTLDISLDIFGYTQEIDFSGSK